MPPACSAPCRSPPSTADSTSSPSTPARRRARCCSARICHRCRPPSSGARSRPARAGPGLLLPGRPARLGLTAMLRPPPGGEHLGALPVSLSVQDGSGIVYAVPAGSLPADGRYHRLIADLSAAPRGALPAASAGPVGELPAAGVPRSPVSQQDGHAGRPARSAADGGGPRHPGDPLAGRLPRGRRRLPGAVRRGPRAGPLERNGGRGRPRRPARPRNPAGRRRLAGHRRRRRADLRESAPGTSSSAPGGRRCPSPASWRSPPGTWPCRYPR